MGLDTGHHDGTRAAVDELQEVMPLELQLAGFLFADAEPPRKHPIGVPLQGLLLLKLDMHVVQAGSSQQEFTVRFVHIKLQE